MGVIFCMLCEKSYFHFYESLEILNISSNYHDFFFFFNLFSFHLHAFIGFFNSKKVHKSNSKKHNISFSSMTRIYSINWTLFKMLFTQTLISSDVFPLVSKICKCDFRSYFNNLSRRV